MKNSQVGSGIFEQEIIHVDPDSCILCYACVRECPVKSIEVKANLDHVRIIPERCIACGSCYMVCPTGAVRIISNLEKMAGILNDEVPAVAIIDPSISGEFPDITDYRNFVGMIRALGFNGVYDMSFGVELAARLHADFFIDFKGKYRISSKCPSVVSFIEKYYIQHIDNLVPVLTPGAIMARIIRQSRGLECRIVWINPCLATHLDSRSFPEDCRIDAIVNFPELRELFARSQVNENSVEFSDFDPPTGRLGALFPLSTGFLQSAGLMEELTSSNFLSADGRQNMIDAMDEFASSYDVRKHLDLFYCEGCIMGPGMSPGGHKFRRRTLVTDFALKMQNTVSIDIWQNDLGKFSKTDLSRIFHSDNQQLPVPEESEINDVLSLIGKTGEDNTDKGCLACGYKSCREFAISVLQGLAKPEMCHLYGTKNRQEYIKSLRSANEQLARTQKVLQETERQAREEKEMVREFSETLAAVIQKIPSGVVIVNDQLRVIQANRAFIEILGEEIEAINEVIPGLKGADLRSLMPAPVAGLFTFVLQNNQEIPHKDVTMGERILNLSVFPIKKNSSIGAILRDLSSPEVQKEEVIQRVNEVIDNNLEMVQKIGFLLGEGASDTERMLNSIIQYYRSGESK